MNEIRLTSARDQGSKKTTFQLCFKQQLLTLQSTELFLTLAPNTQGTARSSLNFIITLEEDTLLFLLSSQSKKFEKHSYFLNNSPGWGDVFSSSLTPNSNNHSRISGEVGGGIGTSGTDSWLMPATSQDGWEERTVERGQTMETSRKCGQLGGDAGGYHKGAVWGQSMKQS